MKYVALKIAKLIWKENNISFVHVLNMELD